MARSARGEALRGVQSFDELRERLRVCGDADWQAMATDARWKHTVVGIKMGGFEDGDLLLLLREAERLGGRLLVEGLPAGTPLMAKAAMTELVDVLFEAGMCSLDPGSGAKELAAEPTSRQAPWRSGAGERADLGKSQAGVGDALRQAAELLRGGAFQHVLEALEAIDTCRLELCPGTLAEAAQLDRLEAEGLRQYAYHQAEAERYGFAIDGYLEKAIKLDPRRAELYTDRARFRLQQACPWLPQDGEFPSDAGRVEASRALEDCNLALSLDPCLPDAFELQLPVLLAMEDLAAAERLASRGEKAVSDPERSQALRQEWRYARTMRQGIEQAEAILGAIERQPAEVEQLLTSLRTEAGPRLEPPLRRRLEGLLQRARMQRDFEEAYCDKAAKATFDNSWAQLFDPRRAAGSKAQSSTAPGATQPPPPAPGGRDRRHGHAWGRPRRRGGAADGDGEEGRGGGDGAGRSGSRRPEEAGRGAVELRSGGGSGPSGGRAQPGGSSGGGSGPAREAPRGGLRRPREAAREAAAEGKEFETIIAGLQRCLDGLRGRERQRVLRQLFLEWHPDKRPQEQELATKVFQWLQGLKDQEG